MHVRTYAEHASRLDTKIEKILNPTPKVPILLSICFYLLLSYHHHVVSYRNLFFFWVLMLVFFSSRLNASYCLLLISSLFMLCFSCSPTNFFLRRTHIFIPLYSLRYSLSFSLFPSTSFSLSPSTSFSLSYSTSLLNLISYLIPLHPLHFM